MEEYKEIDLYQFFKVLNEGKKITLSFFLLFFLASLIYVKYAPKTYIISSSIEIGSTESGLFESPVQLSARLGKGFYGDYPNLTSVPVGGTNILDISLATKESPEEGEEFLRMLNAKVIESHQAILDAKKNKLEKLVESLKKEEVYLLSKGQQVAAIRLQIITLQTKIEEDKFEITKIIAEPETEEKKPNAKLIVSAGAFLGLFLGAVFISFREWFKINKNVK